MVAYHDLAIGNQDPYIWHDRFLHSMCKINTNKYKADGTQLNVYRDNEGSPAIKKGDVHFWCTAEKKKKLTVATGLYCDAVFVVDDVMAWDKPNLPNIEALQDIGIGGNPLTMLPTDENYKENLAYWDHIFWASYDHHWVDTGSKLQTRHTLVADPQFSFQPQNGPLARVCRKPLLVNLSDFLLSHRVFHELQDALANDYWGIELPSHVGSALYDYLAAPSFTKIRGSELKQQRQRIAKNGVFLDPFRHEKKAKLPPYLIVRVGDMYALKDWRNNLLDRRFHDLAIGPWTFRRRGIGGHWYFLGQEEENGGWQLYYIKTESGSGTNRPSPPGYIQDTGRLFVGKRGKGTKGETNNFFNNTYAIG
ncbi:MAG: hypothetical protein KAI39_12150 [Desulfobulbaceae bacterium]|nr:hypothetical protein [Desulfobulbaceae bacterium]